MKGGERNEYIWRGNRRGGFSGITEFGDEKERAGEGRGKNEMGANHERDGAGRHEEMEG